VAGRCLVAGAASALCMLMGVDAGYEWFGLGMPFLCIDAQGTVSGTMLR
jgi:hypothetical protein